MFCVKSTQGRGKPYKYRMSIHPGFQTSNYSCSISDFRFRLGGHLSTILTLQFLLAVASGAFPLRCVLPRLSLPLSPPLPSPQLSHVGIPPTIHSPPPLPAADRKRDAYFALSVILRIGSQLVESVAARRAARCQTLFPFHSLSSGSSQLLRSAARPPAPR